MNDQHVFGLEIIGNVNKKFEHFKVFSIFRNNFSWVHENLFCAPEFAVHASPHVIKNAQERQDSEFKQNKKDIYTLSLAK